MAALSTVQTLENQMGAGSMQFGSSADADSADGLRFVHGGEDAVYAPGTTGNYVAAEAFNGVIATGDLVSFDYRADLDVTGGVLLADKRSHLWVSINSTQLQLRYQEADGGAFRVISSEYGVFVPGIRQRVRIAGEVGGDLRFYSRPDGDVLDDDGWTLNDTQEGPVSVDLLDGLTVGASRSDGSVQAFATGVVHKARWDWTTESETITHLFDPSDLSEWTLHQSTSGYPAALIDASTWLTDGVDDHGLLPADFDPDFSSEDLTYLTVVRSHDPGINAGDVIAANKGVNADKGFALIAYKEAGVGISARVSVSDGVSEAFGSSASSGAFDADVVVGFRYDNGSGLLESFVYDKTAGLALSATRNLSGLGDCSTGTQTRVSGRTTGATPFTGAVAVPMIAANQPIADAYLEDLCERLLTGAY